MTDIEDVGDEDKVKVKKTKSVTKREKETEDLRAILNTYGGRAFIWRVLSDCGVFASSFTGDAAHTFYREGKRSVGLEIVRDIVKVDVNLYNKMQYEAVEREK